MIYHFIFSNYKEVIGETKEAIGFYQTVAKSLEEAVKIAERVNEDFKAKYCLILGFVEDGVIPLKLIEFKPVTELSPDYYFPGDEW